jgi:hypothetical protein
MDKYLPGVYIPPEVLKADIAPLAKILYGALQGFNSFETEGVWATRKTLADIIYCLPQRITELVKILVDANLVFFNGYKTTPNTNQKIRLIRRVPPNEKDLGGVSLNTYTPPKSKDLPSKDNNKEERNTTESSTTVGDIKKPSNPKNLPNKRNGLRPSYFRFAEQIQSKQKQARPAQFNHYTPTELQSQITNGAITIDELVRLNKFEFEYQIKPVILWAIKDSFWSNKVDSIAPLRKKSSSNGEMKFMNIYKGWCKDRNINPKRGRTAKDSDFTFTDEYGKTI